MTEETFEGFKNSFSYGSRTDLTFKFLKSLSPENAADFFAGLLEKVGNTLDDGDDRRLVDHVIEWQIEAYRRKEGRKPTYLYDAAPLLTPAKPLRASRLALITSSGHFERGNDPMPLGVANMTQDEATARISEFMKLKPDLSPIPMSREVELDVRHGGYDIRGSLGDRNVTFPLDRLHELAADGVIGDLHQTGFSFVGAAAQGRIKKETGPELATMLVDDEVDVALLVPV